MQNKNSKFYGENDDKDWLKSLEYKDHYNLKCYLDNLERLINNIDKSRPSWEDYKAKMQERYNKVYAVWVRKDMEWREHINKETTRTEISDEGVITLTGSYARGFVPAKSLLPRKTGNSAVTTMPMPLPKPKEEKDDIVLDLGKAPPFKKPKLHCDEDLSTEEEMDSLSQIRKDYGDESQKPNW